MMEYKRLTKQNQEPKTIFCFSGSMQDFKIYKRLQELEDKIEQGTIIEFPRMFKAIDRTGWIVEYIDESGCVCRDHFFSRRKGNQTFKGVTKC